jgi:hypothetical protein
VYGWERCTGELVFAGDGNGFAGAVGLRRNVDGVHVGSEKRVYG